MENKNPEILWEYKIISVEGELIKVYVDEVNGELRLNKMIMKEANAPMTLGHLCLNQVSNLPAEGALAFYTDLLNNEKERAIAIAQYKEKMEIERRELQEKFFKDEQKNKSWFSKFVKQK